MNELKTLSKFILGDMVVHYLVDENRQVEFALYPLSKMKKFCLPKNQKTTLSLIQAKLKQDSYDKNFSNGMTMFNSQTSRNISLIRQKSNRSQKNINIKTYLKDNHNNFYTHNVFYDRSTCRLKIWSDFTNGTEQIEQLDFLSSFVLNSLSPFYDEEPQGDLDLIRLRSKWSMEGRVEQRPIEMYDLEKSWKSSGLALERFNQYGTMPVRGFFPILGLKDKKEDVIWLTEFDARASWQMNAARVYDRLVFFGGLPDRDNGNWFKLIDPGETYETPPTYLTVGNGNLLNVSQRLQKKTNKKLPIVYNEWGTSWGHPSEKLVNESISILKKHAVDYYVIDAGWYKSKTDDFNDGMGDWKIDITKFPHGLKTVVDNIHGSGMKAGIWFEFEGLGKDSKNYYKKDMLIKRDNWPVTTLKRRFLNMRLPQVQNFIKERVIDQLKGNGFDYLKIDYNDSIGIGADGDDSGAQELQNQITATLQTINKIYESVPHIIIENCSSGGHRMTPAFIESTDLSSFSDAHETDSIPIIAANELNVIPASKNLIWCTIHPEDSKGYLQYHIISTYLGRICMSGDIRNISETQWETIDAGINFYKKISDLISIGMPFRYGTNIVSYGKPQGYQVSGFSDNLKIANSKKIVLMIYQFAGVSNQIIDLPIDISNWSMIDSYGSGQFKFQFDKEKWRIKLTPGSFRATAFIFKRK
jgi:alpha-galactosidase